MKHHQIILTLVLAFLISFAGQSVHAGESITLQRTASDGLKLQGSLEKDIYKSVPYQAEYEAQESYQAEEDYTVDVPYQAEEDYIENVPYQAEETYYENVPYTDTETYYEDVPYQDRESYEDTETYYDNDYVCHTKTDYERVCHNERFCAPPPGERNCQMVEECGTNARGERICKTRKVCENGPRNDVCVDREVCNNEPKSRQECGYERVAKTRSVTKYRSVTRYRQELRTRTVTKYRSEARTRTVTKYRQETRQRTVTKYRQETRQRTVTRYRTVTKCCVTRYRDEFDHTWKMELQVVFPEQATLQPQEIEKFKASIKGNESAPQVSFDVLQSIFGYKIAKQDIKSSSSIIELALAPKYNQSNFGEKMIGRVELSGTDDQFNELLIEDKGIKPRVQTQYRYRILDKENGQVKAEGEASSTNAVNGSLEIQLPQALSSDSDYVIQISATRSGVVLENSFSFSLTKEILFQRWSGDNFGKQTFKNAVFNEDKNQSIVEFTDEGVHPKLETKYKLSVLTMQNEEIWSSVFKATEVLDAKKEAKLLVPASALTKQDDLIVLLQVQRAGRRLANPVQFSVSMQRNFVSLEEAKDSKKIHSLNIEGHGLYSRLVFVDNLKKSSKIKTEYKVVLLRPGGLLWLKKKLLKEFTLNDAQVQEGNLNLSLKDLGVSSKDLEDYVKSGKKIFIEMTAVRKSVDKKETISSIFKEMTVEVK